MAVQSRGSGAVARRVLPAAVMSWVIGFVTFMVVSVAARVGVDWLLDAWWALDGLDPAERPPLDAGGEWILGWLIGLGAGALVTNRLGAD